MTGNNKLAVLLAVALTTLLAVVFAGAVRAETFAEGDQVMVRESDITRPSRGMTMQAVESKFGAPQERHAAVGEPPISRWDYPGFKVFFEKGRVIHWVVDPASKGSRKPAVTGWRAARKAGNRPPIRPIASAQRSPVHSSGGDT